MLSNEDNKIIIMDDDIATVQALCVNVPWTMSPTTDLIAEIRMNLDCSPREAAKIYERTIEAGAIRQVHKIEVQPLPSGPMSKGGGLGVPTGLSKWEAVAEEE